MAISQNFSDTRPSLSLNFAKAKSLDPRITFTRSSTGTYVDDNGLIVVAPTDSPRFDHDPTTGVCNGLLIEESRTNAYQQSSNMSDVYWGAANLTTTAAAAVAPDGTTTATLIVATTTTATHALKPYMPLASTATITVSVFLKSNGDQYFTIRGDNQSNYCTFDLINGTVTSSSTLNSTTSSIVAYPNGWYRCIVTYTPSATVNDPEFYIANSSTYNISTFSGTGTNGFYIWGGQLETGEFPTSYIPTSGTSVTRSADLASITGTNFSSWFNPSEGTIVAHVSNRASLKHSSIYAFDIGTASTAEQLVNTSSSFGTNEQIFARVSSSTTGLIYSGDIVVNPKHAYAYKNADFGVAANGTSYVLTGTSRVPTGLNNLKIGRYTSGAIYSLHGTLSQLVYYPSRLSNQQLAFLTK
jgi:hypothetical protein